MGTDIPVSVVIPVWNGARYLGAAIDSVLGQSVQPFEVLVIDDGSDDDSVAVAKGFGGIVRCLEGPHEGGAQALNRGIAAASQAWIAFLDADDLWLPEKLQLQMQALADDPALDVVYSHLVQFVSPELPEERRARFAVPDGAQPARAASTFLGRRSLVERVGLFATDLRTGWFIDWTMRAADLGVRDRILREVLVRRRIHGDNLGLRDPGARRDYLEVVRRSLMRRRQQSEQSGG